MRVFRNIFEFYLNASIHVALAVYALSWITLKEFNLPYDENVLYFIFFATITGYNFIKYFGIARFHHRRLASWLKVIQIFSLLCFLLMCYYVFNLESNTLYCVLVLGVVTFLYAIPFIPKNYLIDNHQNLRSISGVKIYVISFVWACVTVILPVINDNYEINNDVIITFLQRFLLTAVLILPFDIRDMQYDSIKLSTIPQTIGINKTKWIGVGVSIIFFFMEYLKDNVREGQVFALLCTTVLLLFTLAKSSKKQDKYYSSFFVESIPIIWLLLLCFFNNFI